MREVGAFEAKTHLSDLLAAVAAGETIAITRRGKAVAQLVPMPAPMPDRMAALARLRQLGTSAGLTRDEIGSARDAGRR